MSRGRCRLKRSGYPLRPLTQPSPLKKGRGLFPLKKGIVGEGISYGAVGMALIACGVGVAYVLTYGNAQVQTGGRLAAVA